MQSPHSKPLVLLCPCPTPPHPAPPLPSQSYTTSEYCIEEMHYAIRAVYSSRTRRLLPVAWRKEDVPKELGGWTYLEVKEGREGELADDIRDWLGECVLSWTLLQVDIVQYSLFL